MATEENGTTAGVEGRVPNERPGPREPGPDDNFLVVVIGGRPWREVIEDLRKFVGVDGEVVCPVRTEQRHPKHRKSKKLVEVVKPLLEGYVLVRCGVEADWRGLGAVRGCSGALKAKGADAECPLRVKAREVRAMRTVEIDPALWEGAAVQFVEGPMAGHVGRWLNGGVELEVFGRTTRFAVHPISLRRV